MITRNDLYIQFQKETGYSLDKIRFMVKLPEKEYANWLEENLLEAWNQKKT